MEDVTGNDIGEEIGKGVGLAFTRVVRIRCITGIIDAAGQLNMAALMKSCGYIVSACCSNDRPYPVARFNSGLIPLPFFGTTTSFDACPAGSLARKRPRHKPRE